MHSHKRHHRRDLIDDAKSFIHEHDPFQKKSPSTIYRTVYKTLDPTFSGSVGGYTTIGQDNGKDATTTQKKSSSTAKAKAASTNSASNKDTTLPASITDPVTSSLPTTLATKTTSDDALKQASSASTSLSTGTNAADTQSSSGTSGSAKAGIAIGVMAAVLLVFVGVWFFFKKRRAREEESRQHLDDDEKINGPFRDRPVSVHTTPTTPTVATAPRLSLRPVTQFLPSLEKRNSRGATALLGGAGAAHPTQKAQAAPVSPMRSPGQSAWERPMTSDSNHVENPFGNHAERAQTPVHSSTVNATPISAQFPPLNNGDAHQPEPASPPMTASTPTVPDSPESAVVGIAGTSAVVVANGAAVASNLTRKASMRKDGPKPLDLTLPPGSVMAPIPASPAGTEFSMSSTAPGQVPGPSQGAAAIATAGGPNNSTVHRVQLDFTPTLEDEMGLKAGQLVRLLHEYDDGWALCIRLDRSQQGVVPRTCLSARPVKPRPQQGASRTGPPVRPSGPGLNGPPGPNSQPRPMSPAGHPGSRPQSPAGRPISPYRPQSPAGARSQSPAGRSQSPGPRSRSPSGATRRNSPPGPSPMNPNIGSVPQQQQTIERKPVPGQAY